MVNNVIKRSKTAKSLFFTGTNAPLLRKIYKSVYRLQINKKLNEFTYPPSISIEAYNVCNLKCIMCPYKNMTRKKSLCPWSCSKK